MNARKQIARLESEGYGLYAIATAMAMRDPHSRDVRDVMRRLRILMNRIKLMEESHGFTHP
jgi:hypothetical protein